MCVDGEERIDNKNHTLGGVHKSVPELVYYIHEVGKRGDCVLLITYSFNIYIMSPFHFVDGRMR